MREHLIVQTLPQIVQKEQSEMAGPVKWPNISIAIIHLHIIIYFSDAGTFTRRPSYWMVPRYNKIKRKWCLFFFI